MLKSSHLLATVGSALILASCGSGTDQVPTGESTMASADAAPTGADNPFAEAEARMSEAMMAAVGSSAGDSWARKMVIHHQGAIDMSQVMLGLNPPADVAEMARTGIEKQRKDMEAIQKLFADGAPAPATAELYRQAMMDMDKAMEQAKGSTVAETFMLKMIAHHRGAVAMADVALANGVSGALREQIRKTRAENVKDAEMTEAMLKGASIQHGASEPATAGPTAVKPSPAGDAKPKAVVRPTPAPAKPAPKPVPKPSPTHDMGDMKDMKM